MKAEEVRLGNYLRVKNTDIESVVDAIFNYDNIHLQGNGVANRIEQVEPIPLSEEWLLKFGFKKIPYSRGNSFRLDKFEIDKGHSWDYYLYSVVGRNDDGINEPCIEINYVHQLQNLVHALTGNDLTLNH